MKYGAQNEIIKGFNVLLFWPKMKRTVKKSFLLGEPGLFISLKSYDAEKNTGTDGLPQKLCTRIETETDGKDVFSCKPFWQDDLLSDETRYGIKITFLK